MSKMPKTYAEYQAIGTIGGAQYEAEFTYCPESETGTWYYDEDVFLDGELEFEGNEVIDYDGVTCLPIPVQKLIESKGFRIA